MAGMEGAIFFPFFFTIFFRILPGFEFFALPHQSGSPCVLRRTCKGGPKLLFRCVGKKNIACFPAFHTSSKTGGCGRAPPLGFLDVLKEKPIFSFSPKRLRGPWPFFF